MDARRISPRRLRSASSPRRALLPTRFERFFSQETDVRFDLKMGEQILALLAAHDVRSVAMVDRIIGCPHEEGIDYPDGAVCPRCPYWAGRDRWIDELID